jgi:ubiquinone/menaquinone biosynthesis C-methylase UbiE
MGAMIHAAQSIDSWRLRIEASQVDERDPLRRFSRTVDDYRRYRPSYPDALVDWIVAHLPSAARVVDVGAGTGIFTRQLAARDLDVIGVEPNADMHAAAEREGGARYVAGEAAALNLPSESADLIIAAQAFHWFPLEATLAEWRRVARRDGWCGVVFNLRASTPFADAYQKLLNAIIEYRVAPKGAEALQALEAKLPSFESAEFEHVQQLDRDGFLGRAFSSSFVAHAKDHVGVRAALEALFGRFSDEDRVTFVYRSVARLWRPYSITA